MILFVHTDHQPGPTGHFPQGKLTPDDEGEIMITVTNEPKTQNIIIAFGTPVAWLAMNPDTAETLARAILAHARAARS